MKTCPTCEGTGFCDGSPRITIPEAEYKRLKADSDQLAHLEANGVDNWEGYSRCGGDEEDEDGS